MNTYSLLFIDENENIDGSRQVACASDEYAMATASLEAKQHRVVEVWDGNRLIGLIRKALQSSYNSPL
jgi:hypothetical protein